MRIINVLLSLVVASAGLIGDYLTYVHRFEMCSNLGGGFFAHSAVRACIISCTLLVLGGLIAAVAFVFANKDKNRV